MQKLVFYACSALVGQVVKPRECRVWFEDPNVLSYDPDKSVHVNLALSPGLVDPALWSTVQVDDSAGGPDSTPLGATTIGPDFPGGEDEGGVYLVEKLWLQHQAKILWPPVVTGGGPAPREFQTYEFQSLLYRDDSGIVRRYHGFHAQLVKAQGRVALLKIFEPGASQPTGPWWIDLDDVGVCDPGSNGHTEIGLPGLTEGAVFLSWATASQFSLRMPKLPPSAGAVRFPIPAP